VNKNKKEASFEKLVLELREQGFENIGVELVRKKLKTIKTVYREELSKITKLKKTAAGTDDLYRPKLAWFELQYPPCKQRVLSQTEARQTSSEMSPVL
jgi:hypothetical protein